MDQDADKDKGPDPARDQVLVGDLDVDPAVEPCISSHGRWACPGAQSMSASLPSAPNSPAWPAAHSARSRVGAGPSPCCSAASCRTWAMLIGARSEARASCEEQEEVGLLMPPR